MMQIGGLRKGAFVKTQEWLKLIGQSEIQKDGVVVELQFMANTDQNLTKMKLVIGLCDRYGDKA